MTTHIPESNQPFNVQDFKYKMLSRFVHR